MTDPRIRRATAADAAALARVYRSAYRENRELGFPAKAESATEREVAEWIVECRVYVATVEEAARDDAADDDAAGDATGDDAAGEGAIVGGVRLAETDPDRVKLSRLGVHGDWKGEGVGSSLVAHAERAARADGYEAIWLTTPGEHPYLPGFYRRRGYEETGTYPLEYREYDEIVMEKRLG